MEHERNLKIYQQMIKPVVASCGYEAIRADELEYLGNITRDIIENLHNADLVVADLSGRNANVYYELGVRHALYRCGTIPIIHKGEKLPFDITNYRAVFYSLEMDGPTLFRAELKSRIKALEKIDIKKTDNPVHEILGDALMKNGEEAAGRQSEMKRLVEENEAIRKKVVELEEQLFKIGRVKRTPSIDLQKIKYKKHKKTVPVIIVILCLIGSCFIAMQFYNKRVVHLRNRPIAISPDSVASLIRSRGFFDARLNPDGQGAVTHRYHVEEMQSVRIVLDKATGLMWQQSGSENFIRAFDKANDYVNHRNRDNYAGFNDWRLPTIEEAMSLMEPERSGILHVNNIFNPIQSLIWTGDTLVGESRIWIVDFNGGDCTSNDINNGYGYVRAVRSRPSSVE